MPHFCWGMVWISAYVKIYFCAFVRVTTYMQNARLRVLSSELLRWSGKLAKRLAIRTRAHQSRGCKWVTRVERFLPTFETKGLLLPPFEKYRNVKLGWECRHGSIHTIGSSFRSEFL